MPMSAVNARSPDPASNTSILNSERGTDEVIAQHHSPEATRNNGHRGLAYTDQMDTDPFSRSNTSKVSWAYNGRFEALNSSLTNNFYNSNLEFVPMLASNAESEISAWKTNVAHSIRFWSCKAVLSFNEPDNCSGGGSCLTVSHAVDAYESYINAMAVGSNRVRFGAPAVSSGQGDGVGLSWLQGILHAMHSVPD